MVFRRLKHPQAGGNEGEENEAMNKLSTGEDSTLGNWLKMVRAVSPCKKSKAESFLLDKIAKAKQGESAEVIMDESQGLMALGPLMLEESHEPQS